MGQHSSQVVDPGNDWAITVHGAVLDDDSLTELQRLLHPGEEVVSP
ncbi:hypothetical protein AS9A_3532 [Hoyosella subflava DQS3-9A1]|uniref:Uncharacterized protein n=1 Tax=Hoyosella subflava (strain DSM 45089 / JCM 17490 / NBRC 109087 / DQS3-9A1) TaxID=443218 RepID=F6ER92_HOYSD|nr:hypothetical protein AS9A_3532 [Hoyosella subflava DQS3-9A1]